MTLWRVFNLTWCPPIVLEYFPRLFLCLLFQVYISALDTPEEVDTFWKGCQEQLGLATNPQRCSIPVLPVSPSLPRQEPGLPASPGLCSAHRFAVQTLKVLLCRVQCERVVVAMEGKAGWDTLLCTDTHHYSVGLLAR